jgi:hypothetical protein
LPGKVTFYGRVLKSVACVVIVRKASDEKTLFFSDPAEERSEMSL